MVRSWSPRLQTPFPMSSQGQCLLDFATIVEKRNWNPREARVLRHDKPAAVAWDRGRAHFGDYISHQKTRKPYGGAKTAFHFLPGQPLPDGDHTALFVGATRIIDEWTFDGSRKPKLAPSREPEFRLPVEHLAYDLDWIEDFEDLVERVVVRWGASARSWSQRAHLQRKEVVEIRREVIEPVFPGFAALETTLEEVPLLPPSWRPALAAVRGVYLLVCPKTGDQYVGSAYGEEGFWGRWSAYAEDGHGGNVLLRKRRKVNYGIAILEVASSAMSTSDIINRERVWKTKLGSRAHGLNAN